MSGPGAVWGDASSALAELHKVMNRAKAKTVLIVTCSIALQHELMCALAATVPSCSGFTIDQIGGIMGAYAAPVRDVATSLPLLVWMHLDIKRGLLFFRQPPLTQARR